MYFVRNIIPDTFAQLKRKASIKILANTYFHFDIVFANEGNSQGRTFYI